MLLWLIVAVAQAGERGSLQVNVAPADTAIAVDGQARGTGSMRVAPLPVGEHNVRLTHLGYLPVDRVVTVSPGQTACISVTMERAAPRKSGDPSDATARAAGDAILAGVVASAGASAAGRPPLEMHADPAASLEPIEVPPPPAVPNGAPPPWEVAPACP